MSQLDAIYTLAVGIGLSLVQMTKAKKNSPFLGRVELIACVGALGSLGGLVFSDRFSGSVSSWLLLGLASAFIGTPSAQWFPVMKGGLVFSAMALWVNTSALSGGLNVQSWSSLAGLDRAVMESVPSQLSSALVALCALFAVGDLLLRAIPQKVNTLEAVVYYVVVPLGLAALFQLARPLQQAGSSESILACLFGLCFVGMGTYRLAQAQSPWVFVRLTSSVSTLTFISIAPLVTTGWLVPLAGFLAAANLALLRNAEADDAIVSNTASAIGLTLGPILAVSFSPNALVSLRAFPGAFPFLCAALAFFSYIVLRFTLSLSSGGANIPKVEWGFAMASLLFWGFQPGSLGSALGPSHQSLWLFGSWIFAVVLAGFVSRNPRYQVNMDLSVPRLPERLPRTHDFKWLESLWRIPFQLAGSLGAFFSLWNVGSIQYGLVVFFCGVVLLFWAALKTQVLW